MTDGYRNQGFAALLAVMGTVFGLGGIVYVITGRAGWPPMLVVVLLALFTVLRLARAGVFVEEDGVKVLNPLNTVRIPWEEIAGFSLKRSGGFAAVGFVDLVDGGRVQAWGIQARNKHPGAMKAPQAAIAELQARFEAERARRTATP